MKNPLYVMLHGLPGTGKTTARSLIAAIHNIDYIVSTDDIIETECNRLGLTYDQGWSNLVKAATARMNNSRHALISNKHSFIDDHTNLTLSSRSRKLSQLPDSYIKICYVFDVTPREWRKRLASRPNKTIPEDVLNNMCQITTFPTMEEGFNAIIKFVH